MSCYTRTRIEFRNHINLFEGQAIIYKRNYANDCIQNLGQNQGKSRMRPSYGSRFVKQYS